MSVPDEDLGRGLTCFVVGPIGDRLAPVGTEPRARYENATQMWEYVFEPATKHFGLEPVRADKISEQGEIPEQIFVLLRDADVVIADLSGGNANVMYELGMRHTRDKMTIQMGEYGHLPFDVNTIRTIQFRRTEAGLIDARENLIDALRSGLRGGGTPVTATRVWSMVPTLDAGVFAAAAAQSQVPDAEDEIADEPGFMDTLADGEAAITELATLIQRVAELMDEYGALARDATEKVAQSDANRGGFAARLLVAKELAASLEGPAGELDELSEDYVTRVGLFAAAVDYLLGEAEAHPEQRKEIMPFFSNIVPLADGATKGNVGVTKLIHSVKDLPKMARVLAPVAKMMTRGLGRVVGANEVIAAWGDRIRSLPDWQEPEGDEAEGEGGAEGS